MRIARGIALATLALIGCRREYRPGDNPVVEEAGVEHDEVCP